MQARFEKVDFAHEMQAGGPHYDSYLLSDFKDHKIDLGTALWSNKKLNVYIDYAFLDADRNPLFKMQTDGDNIKRYSGGDMATAINLFEFPGRARPRTCWATAGTVLWPTR
jgi:hypothetical protein